MITSALLLSGVLFQIQALKSNEKACPYVLVTTAGDRIGTLDVPKRDGKPVKFRLCANSTLTVYPAAEVDWVATEKANASATGPAPTGGLAPTPTRPSLRVIAGNLKMRDADAAVKQNEASGKLRTKSGKEIELADNFFGTDSVLSYLRVSQFVADTSSCSGGRARAYGVVKNVSRMKLRDLKAYVVIGSLRTGENNGQIQTMDPSNLMPGEEAQIFLYLSCDYAQDRAGSTSRGADGSVIVLLPDIAGKAEALERPDGSNPFETPGPKKPPGSPKPPATSPASSQANPRAR